MEFLLETNNHKNISGAIHWLIKGENAIVCKSRGFTVHAVSVLFARNTVCYLSFTVT